MEKLAELTEHRGTQIPCVHKHQPQYTNGFITKCAEYGVDPEELLKAAGWWDTTKRTISKGMEGMRKGTGFMDSLSKGLQGATHGFTTDNTGRDKDWFRQTKNMFGTGPYTDRNGKQWAGGSDEAERTNLNTKLRTEASGIYGLPALRAFADENRITLEQAQGYKTRGMAERKAYRAKNKADYKPVMRRHTFY